MLNTKIWENEKYKISVDDERATLLDKQSGAVLTDTVTIESREKTMTYLKKVIIYQELGNPKEDVLWENEVYELKFSWGGDALELKHKGDDVTIAQFYLKSPEVVELLKKVIAFL